MQTKVALVGLNPRHINAINLKFQGKSNPEIAALLGVTSIQVSQWFCKTGRLRRHYDRYCQELLNPQNPETPVAIRNETLSVAEKIKASAPAALKQIVELSGNAKREQVRYQASADILDRAGYAPVQKAVNVNVVDEMSIEQLDALVGDIIGPKADRAPYIKEAEVSESGSELDVDAAVDELF